MAEILVSDFCDDRQIERPDAGNGGPGVCICAADKEKPMSDRLQRMLENAKAKGEPRRASGANLIACEPAKGVPRRADVPIETRKNEKAASL